jgi:glycosyltransferase involved in cell wall biosynthesis
VEGPAVDRREAMSADGSLPFVVVPCHNEAARLDLERFAALAATGRVRLLFVDDGSTDATVAVLERLAGSTEGIEVMQLARNVGKAEAVRRGLLRGVEAKAAVLGYFDADLATPTDELLRMLDRLEGRPDLSFVLASRVALLGRRITRRARRHYLGRVFATFASIFLRIPVYDTQCGAKVFRATAAVSDALGTPFQSSWVFDVELIGRLLRGSEAVAPVPLEEFEEMPLREWRDVGGSRLGPADMVRAAVDLFIVGYRLNRPRA